jgi:hypothetical protein
LRYVAIHIRPRQEELFADGSREKHFAVVSNIWEWTPERLIQWHREKAGTIEAVHDVVKNELAAGVLLGPFPAEWGPLELVLTAGVVPAWPPAELAASPLRCESANSAAGRAIFPSLMVFIKVGLLSPPYSNYPGGTCLTIIGTEGQRLLQAVCRPDALHELLPVSKISLAAAPSNPYRRITGKRVGVDLEGGNPLF